MKPEAAQLRHFDFFGTSEMGWAIEILAALDPRQYHERRLASARALGLPVRLLDAEVGRLRRAKPAPARHVHGPC
jgi:hypothetical protein